VAVEDPKPAFPLAAGTKLDSLVRRVSGALFERMYDYEGVFRDDSVEWQFDFAEGTIKLQTYVDNYAVAKLQLIGTFDTSANRWIWGCDDDAVPKDVARSATRTKKKLTDAGISELGASPVNCDLTDAWAIWTLAWHWNEAECPMWLGKNEDMTITFVTLDKIQIVEANVT
jgi:hypothetical protein